MAKYKDASTLKKSDLADLTDVERAEFEMFAGIEVESVLARIANTSQDFKKAVAIQLYSKII